LSPALTDVRLDWGEMAATTVPSRVGPVFADEPLRAYGLMRERISGTVTLHASGAAGPMSWSLDVRPDDLVEGSTVGTLAARARIREIEEGGAWSPNRGSRQRERRQDRAVSEIIDLAMEFGLASRETSWVAVHKREVPLTEQATLRRVPIAITSGWGALDRGSASELRMMSAALSFDAAPPAVARHSVAGMPSSSWVSALEAASPMVGSTRTLDRLVALQRADGSWDLTSELVDVLGLPFNVVLEPLAHASGDPDEAKRALATALALAFLVKKASSSASEWKLLAAKATRWLAGVKAVPAGGRTWTELAVGLSI